MPVFILILIATLAWLELTGHPAWAFVIPSLVLVPETMAHAFAALGVDDPAVGWVLLGAIGGLLTGAWIGLRRAGRPVARWRRVTLWMVVFGGLLVAGFRPAGAVVEAPRGDVTARVASATLNLRRLPRARSELVAELQRGTPLEVLGATPDRKWLRVRLATNPDAVGWVWSASVTPRSGAVPIIPVAPDVATPPGTPPGAGAPADVPADAPVEVPDDEAIPFRLALASARTALTDSGYDAAFDALATAADQLQVLTERYDGARSLIALNREYHAVDLRAAQACRDAGGAVTVGSDDRRTCVRGAAPPDSVAPDGPDAPNGRTAR